MRLRGVWKGTRFTISRSRAVALTVKEGPFYEPLERFLHQSFTLVRFGEPVAYFAGVRLDVGAGLEADAADDGIRVGKGGEEEVVCVSWLVK